MLNISENTIQNKLKRITEYRVKEIEAEAWSLLNYIYGTFIPVPIDVEYILEQHPCVEDLDLIKGLQDKFGISGIVFRLKNDKFLIPIDADIADQSPYYYRFTVAEELSHITLHRDIVNETDSIEKAIKLRSDLQYRIMDRNAKRFAAALLMPNRLIIEDGEKLYHEVILRYDFQPANKILKKMIETLRKKYDVSRKAMVYRLNEWPIKIIDRVEFSIMKESEVLLLID